MNPNITIEFLAKNRIRLVESLGYGGDLFGPWCEKLTATDVPENQEMIAILANAGIDTVVVSESIQFYFLRTISQEERDAFIEQRKPELEAYHKKLVKEGGTFTRVLPDGSIEVKQLSFS